GIILRTLSRTMIFGFTTQEMERCSKCRSARFSAALVTAAMSLSSRLGFLQQERYSCGSPRSKVMTLMVTLTYLSAKQSASRGSLILIGANCCRHPTLPRYKNGERLGPD